VGDSVSIEVNWKREEREEEEDAAVLRRICGRAGDPERNDEGATVLRELGA
jgi:hypothetical protein